MWKIFFLSTFLISVQASSIQDFLGEWVPVAFYPVSAYAPYCLRYGLSPYEEEAQCTCADGRNTSLVILNVMDMERRPYDRVLSPILVVDDPSEVMPSLNISCKCADEKPKQRVVIRLVDKNFAILYSNIVESMKSTRTETEPNAVYVLSKNMPPTEMAVAKVMLETEDLKGRRGAIVCTKEYYLELVAKQNNTQ